MRAWVVRGGERGVFEESALREGLVILGWKELPDVGSVTDLEALRALVDETYPGNSSYVIGNWTGQLWRFRSEIAIGDLVVLPRRSKLLAIGRVAGEYASRSAAEAETEHLRRVTWLRTDVDRSEVQPDLLNSLGSLLTVFELRRNDAAARIEALADGKPDPGNPGNGPAGLAYDSPRELLEAAAARENDDPIVLSIRDLLGNWGAGRRGSAIVEQIQQELAAVGLTTDPPFIDGSIDGKVAIVPLNVDPDVVEPEVVAEKAALPPVAYLVSNIASASAAVVSARVDEPLAAAINRMLQGNYSQLPVLYANGALRGAITWESIVHSNFEGTVEKVGDATVSAPTAKGTDALLSKVRDINEHGFVLVIDDDKRVSGIVTTTDLAEQFADRVEPFILVEEVEQRLRRIVDRALASGALALADVRKSLGPRGGKVQSARDLTLGQYRLVLEPPDTWAKVGLSFNHTFFLGWVKQVTDFRNNLMHFSPDPLSMADQVTVRGFLEGLKALDPGV